MVREEKNEKNWSMLLSSQDNTIVISCDEQMQVSSFTLFNHIFSNKINWRNN